MTAGWSVAWLGTPGWTQVDEEALLVGMLSHYTPSGSERPVARWLAEQAAAQGLLAEVDEVGNLIATLPASTSGSAEATGHPNQHASPIVLLGHLDTVPGQIPVWRDGDRLYGRGAVDAKGPLAAFLAATVRIAARDIARSRPIAVVGAVEEEVATSRGARAMLGRWRPAFTVIGEPSGVGAVTLGYKGRLLVDYRIEVPVAHTARPDESVCARGLRFWTALRDAAETWNSEHNTRSAFETLAPSLRSIQSGSDGFSEWCDLTIAYRLPPDFDLTALTAWIENQALVDGATVTFCGAEAAYRVSRKGSLVSAFVRALRAEGLEPAFKLKTGTSDMNVVGPVWQCPVLAYGPGDAALDHTPDEHILLSEYRQSIAVLDRVLTDLVAESVSDREGAPR